MNPRNYRLLLVGQFLGAFGDNFLLAAILGPLTYALASGKITENAVNGENALFGLVFSVPFIFLAPIAGFVNDRMPKTHWLVGGNVGQAAEPAGPGSYAAVTSRARASWPGPLDPRLHHCRRGRLPLLAGQVRHPAGGRRQGAPGEGERHRRDADACRHRGRPRRGRHPLRSRRSPCRRATERASPSMRSRSHSTGRWRGPRATLRPHCFTAPGNSCRVSSCLSATAGWGASS